MSDDAHDPFLHDPALFEPCLVSEHPMANLNVLAQSQNLLANMPEELRAKLQNQQANMPQQASALVPTRTLIALEERLERLEAALRRIEAWGMAYPEEAFPPPSEAYYAKAHQVLTAHTMHLDRIAADCMRHAVSGCARIAREALGDQADRT